MIWAAGLEVTLQGELPIHTLYVPGARPPGTVTVTELVSIFDGASEYATSPDDCRMTLFEATKFFPKSLSDAARLDAAIINLVLKRCAWVSHGRNPNRPVQRRNIGQAENRRSRRIFDLIAVDTQRGIPTGTMNESPVVLCWVVDTTVVLPRTRVCQSAVPGGMKAIRAVFAASVKAPASKIDCPGAVSRDVQKTAFEV